MLDIDEVLAIIPLSRSTLFRMERDHLFPASHSISPGRRAWYEDEILAWQEALPVNDRISKRTRRNRRLQVENHKMVQRRVKALKN
jgi:predicted DNA-binding transcriptional regulator AlpA